MVLITGIGAARAAGIDPRSGGDLAGVDSLTVTARQSGAGLKRFIEEAAQVWNRKHEADEADEADEAEENRQAQLNFLAFEKTMQDGGAASIGSAYAAVQGSDSSRSDLLIDPNGTVVIGIHHSTEYPVGFGVSDAIVIGTDATDWASTTAQAPHGNNGIVIGTSATIDTGDAIAIGPSATAIQYGSVALGADAQAGIYSSSSPPIYDVAVGYDAQSAQAQSTALGAFSQASGLGSTALGAGATSAGTYSTALGNSARAPGNESLAIGYQAKVAANASKAMALGSNASVAGASDIALGATAVTTGTNSVALGAGSSDGGRSSVISVGTTTAQRQVINVANGTSTYDAVNYGQLSKVQTSVSTLGTSVGSLNMSVSNFNMSLGMLSTSVTSLNTSMANLNASVGTMITDVTQKFIRIDNNFKALESQMCHFNPCLEPYQPLKSSIKQAAFKAFATATGLQQPYHDAFDSTATVSSVASAGDDARSATPDTQSSNAQVRGVDDDAVALGDNRIAAGATLLGNNAQAGGMAAVAVGQGANAGGANSAALGAGANAQGNNSVALGSGSKADRDNSVSVGNAGLQRQITNVAPGIQGTDAVNLNQMNTVQNNIASGVAMIAAMAAIPGLSTDKTLSMGVGAGRFMGESGVALGANARVTKNLQFALRIGISAAESVYSAGASYQW